MGIHNFKGVGIHLLVYPVVQRTNQHYTPLKNWYHMNMDGTDTTTVTTTGAINLMLRKGRTTNGTSSLLPRRNSDRQERLINPGRQTRHDLRYRRSRQLCRRGPGAGGRRKDHA